jgi:hypothetical protein
MYNVYPPTLAFANNKKHSNLNLIFHLLAFYTHPH